MFITTMHRQCMFVRYFMTYFRHSNCSIRLRVTHCPIGYVEHAVGLLVMSRTFLPAAEADRRSIVRC